MRHILEAQQFSRAEVERLFKAADHLRSCMKTPEGRRKLAEPLGGKLCINLFYEPSTRTRISFEAAEHHLGMQFASTENARDFSSAAKGETLEDTIQVLSGYRPDAIVLRHDKTGGAARAAGVSTVPIINAGDGRGQHPTQALLDLYTIEQELGGIDGLTIAIGGDLKNGRTARSLAYLLAKFKQVSLIFVSPPELRMGTDIKRYLQKHEVVFREETAVEKAATEADVLYWTRIQRERMSPATYRRVKSCYVINQKILKRMKTKAAILHPLPRLQEISTAVDSDPRAAYFRQAKNGMYIRMALLKKVLTG